MGKLLEKNQLKEMHEFLASRKQLTVLAERAEVSLRTVYDTFYRTSSEELKGKQLIVYRKAIELINEINELPTLAGNALKNKA